MDVEPFQAFKLRGWASFFQCLIERPEIYSSRGGSRDCLSRVVQVFGQGDSETASDKVGPYHI